MEQKFQIGTTECTPITQRPKSLLFKQKVLVGLRLCVVRDTLEKSKQLAHTCPAVIAKAQQCLIEAATEADVCEFVERSVRHYYLMRQRPFLKRVRDVYAGGFSTALRTELGAISNANTNKNKN